MLRLREGDGMTWGRSPTITLYTSQEYLRKLGLLLDDGPMPEAKAIYNTPRVAEIQEKVADSFQIPLCEMTSARRARDVARPRQVAMYLAKQLTPRSLPEIGRMFGNRDHTTVIHAIRQVERLIKLDPEFRARVADAAEGLA
jgi:chromosomal replication initiation ATPase DnaA